MSEPKIEAFTHKEIYDESMEFVESDLQKSIIRCEVNNSIICYEKLIKDGKSIDPETVYDLLDLVCFFNEENEKEHYIEEDFFRKQAKKQNISTWKDNGFAEKLFESIEPKNDRVYSSIIMGMAKHNQCERALSLYRQAIDLNFKLNTATYNALINICNELHSTNEERWKTVVDLLKQMNTNQIAPDLGTLNAVLKQISKFKFFVQSNELILKTLNEFAFKFGIRPSLGTYYHLLSNFYRSRNSRNPFIYEIIDKIANEKFEPQDLDDVINLFNKTNLKISKNIEMGYDQSLQWTGKTLSLCLSILNKNQDLDMGYTILEKIYSLRNELYDQPESKVLSDYVNLTFKNKRFDYALFCLRLCRELDKKDVIDIIRQEFERSESNIQDENLRNKFRQFLG
ncbi:PTCD3-like protein, mitochondrial-like protein [Euroglyphus maynei]|uniref:Small ribosomal subunit protein mS39 n=1 Tax=Euroglyphus maynei TaxID=6958 RepID=A0A1Y3AT84_EURMA|nr:PTCD3-like protein, mitochondrial-like protein [Euroglyphus maynei]